MGFESNWDAGFYDVITKSTLRVGRDNIIGESTGEIVILSMDGEWVNLVRLVNVASILHVLLTLEVS